ncbi:MAG TPA: hypothetical protein VJ901_06635 [Thermoanaerobaculia bacterium]|nr:hypothetical protein [Thermoanaerobaculia bacterium]
MYASYDSRYRTKPQRWRIALVSLCHILLGVTITNAIVSIGDIAILRSAPNMPDAWVIYATPWLTLKPVLPHIVKARDFTNELLIWTGGLLLLALIAVYLWPARRSIASRLWAVTLGQTLATFGGAVFVFRGYLGEVPQPMFYAAPVIAAIICMTGEWSTNTLLGAYFELDSPVHRLGMWALRMLPGLAVIAFLSYFIHYDFGVIAAGGLAAITLLANLMKKPSRSMETMREVEMREAAAAMPFIAALVLAGAFFAFGYRPPRGFVVAGGHITREPLAGAVKAIEPPKPVIDIHWSRRH